jgi:predicted kinase
MPPRLVAIGGFSGTGKSTLAAAIAAAVGPPPGARVIASDRLRKAVFGVSAETRLPEQAYASRVSEQVYAGAAAAAARIVTAGTAVIVESVFDRPQDRERIEQVARNAGVPFSGLWLDAPAPALLARVAARRGDPSDATADVVRAQLARDPGDLGWSRINAAMPIDEVAAQAMRALNM